MTENQLAMDAQRPPDTGAAQAGQDPPPDPTLEAIRNMVTEADPAPAPAVRAVAPEPVASAPAPAPAQPAGAAPVAEPKPRRASRWSLRRSAPRSSRRSPPRPSRWPARRAAAWNWLKRRTAATARQLGLFLRRPDTPRRFAILLLVTLYVLKPWFFVWLFVLLLLVAMIVYFSLGPDRVAETVAGWHGRLRQRDPQKAERIRRRAASVSKRVTALVERLPERWTQGLYLPDFEDSPKPSEKMKIDPFDRLAARAGNGGPSEGEAGISARSGGMA